MWRAVFSYGVLLVACVPERPLSSYREPQEVAADVTSARGTGLPGASGEAAGMEAASGEAAGMEAAGMEAADMEAADMEVAGGEAAGANARIVDDGVANDDEGSGPLDAAPQVDAGPPNIALVCPEECACERSAVGEFMFCATPVSHDDAVARCSLAGGSLVSVGDSASNAWLTERMSALGADDFWLSGTDLDDEGVWRWSDGSVFFDVSAPPDAPRGYAPWLAGQPNDLDGEDCMNSSGGLWLDLDCSGEVAAFVCQG